MRIESPEADARENSGATHSCGPLDTNIWVSFRTRKEACLRRCTIERIAIANDGAEILDFGYPQNTETETLKMYITTEGVKSEKTIVGHTLPVFRDSRLTMHTGRYFKNHNASYRSAIVEKIRH